MLDTLSVLFNRAKDIFQSEGMIPLLRRGFSFLIPYFFRYRTLYLYELTLEERNEADFIPKIRDFTLKIVCSNQQADELANDVIDLRSYFTNARQRLNKGAIAFCIFVGAELAHVSWVAMTEEAKNTFDSIPYRIDFPNKEACLGGSLVIPKYRGQGLATYSFYSKCQFFRERGIKVTRYAVATSNIASQRVAAKFGSKIYARLRCVRILRWDFCRETRLTHSVYHD